MFSNNLKILVDFLFVNLILSLVLSLQYFFYTGGAGGFSYFYLFCALISNTFILYVIAFFVTVWLCFLRRKIFAALLVVIFILLQILLLCDIGIYKVFKFHINAVIWNFITTPNSWDSIELGFLTYAIIFAIVASVVIFEIWFMRFISRRVDRRRRFMPRFSLAILFLFVFADKGIYAYGDLFNHTGILRYSKVFPLYQGLTVKSIAKKRFGMNVEREETFKFEHKSSLLNYPLAQPDLSKVARKPNILWIVSDAFRFDMLSSDITPNIFKFAKKSQNFKNHYSGGISTRFGIFSMFYGVYAYNFHQFLGERRSPVLIDSLKKLGYKFSINSSTSLTFPEFRKTAFVSITDSVHDNFAGDGAVLRDKNQVDYFVSSLAELKKNAPFFSFVFLDSPHGRVYPPEFEKFKVKSKYTNYLMVTEKEAKDAKLNYQNALYYNDALIGKIFTSLEEKDLLKDTIVIVTGDHGEEFFENGSFTHNSAFSHYQSKVPLVFYVPWMEPKEYEHQTSHLDLVASTFDLMGIDANPNSYSNGFSMFGEKKRDYSVICQWSKCAYDNNENIIVFSMETYSAGIFDYYDKNYVLKDSKPSVKENKELFDAMRDFSRFHK